MMKFEVAATTLNVVGQILEGSLRLEVSEEDGAVRVAGFLPERIQTAAGVPGPVITFPR